MNGVPGKYRVFCLGAGLLIWLSCGCVAPGSYYNEGYGVNYYEPYGYAYDGWGPNYFVGPYGYAGHNYPPRGYYRGNHNGARYRAGGHGMPSLPHGSFGHGGGFAHGGSGHGR